MYSAAPHRKFFGWRGTVAWILAAPLAAVLGCWLLLRASLPPLDGARRDSNLAAPLSLERDANGIVTVSGRAEDDVAFGLGFAHGQDRYFQMDSARRLAAGELAALFGARALPLDRRTRVFRWRARVRTWLEKAAPDADRRWLQRYTDGVNAGLASLRGRPFEYWLLRAPPQPWAAEDSMLVLLSMFWQLQSGEIADERFRLDLQEALQAPEGGEDADARARAIFALLLPRASEWNAPMTTDETAVATPVLPTPEQLDLRGRKLAAVMARSSSAAQPAEEQFPGSNNWGLAGSRTRSGAALIANDMHLGLGVPAVWYRARLRVAGLGDQNGVTLPGVPGLVAGSNGEVAWGFTNSYGDWLDLRRVSCGSQGQEWVASDGPRPFVLHRERLATSGGELEEIDVRESADEVVLEFDAARSQCTLMRWVALGPDGFNLNLRRMARARSVDDVVALAPELGVPQQNLVVGDRAGHVAWTIAGRTLAGPHPIIVDPPVGAVWTANARAISGEAERVIGGDEWQWGAGYDLGARAQQIRLGLEALTKPATPGDMLRIQLDDRALYLARWRGVLLAVLDENAVRNRAARAELRALVEQWDARASVDSVGYRLVRSFQRQLAGATWGMLLGALGLDPEKHSQPRRFDASVWRLVNEQPAHLLAGDFADWREFMLAQVDAVLQDFAATCPKLARCRWGNVNRSSVRHSLSPAVPFLGLLLDMPDSAVAGDSDMPRVQSPAFGASERFAVSPGHEAYGYLHIAGGQSGHPLSTYYRSGYEDWLRGRPTPFLPGLAQHKLSFFPDTP